MRVIAFFALLLLTSFSLNVSQIVLADNPAAEAYRDQRNAVPVVERRAFAINAITRTQDSDVLLEALEDLLNCSASDDENSIALMLIDGVLPSISNAKENYQKVELYRAKLLRRLGRIGEAEAIFARAFEEQWGQAHYEYERSLLEARHFADAAILEFERVSGSLNGYQVAPYEESVEDLGRFKMFLRRLKAEEPGVLAMDAVFAKIDSPDASSLMKEMAKALCLSEDGRHEEALEVIERIESSVDRAQTAALFIPLHKSMILMDQDEIEDAQETFRAFMEEAGDNHKLIYAAGIRFARSMEETREGRTKMVEVTSQLIDSPIIQDAAVKATFSNYDIAHLYDLHQMGLSSGGRFDESIRICQKVLSEFPLDTLPVVNCALNYAKYLQTSHRSSDWNHAEAICNRILNEAASIEIVPWVYLTLSEIQIAKNDFEAARDYLDEFKRIQRFHFVDRNIQVKSESLEDFLNRLTAAYQ